ncbi:MAG: methyltransferase [Desulfobacterales bacterium]|nr:methyltransferase [Desulfobacterales bacterium]
MKNRPPLNIGPDSDLHIYYLEGRLPARAGIRDPNFIGNWEEEGFSFLFFKCPAEETVSRLVNTYLPLKLLDSYHMTYAQWQGGRVEPVRVGRFLLQPPWVEAAPESGVIEIVLDPGVVFGTGNHPTTCDCLEAIDRVCAGKQVHRMLDLGTGTGVLALAAIKLGCRQAVAVDFNFLAARTTLENVRLNDMDRQILVINGDAQDITGYRADLLVANIHYDVMHQLVRTTGFLDKKWFILSGLLRSEAKRISDYLANRPVQIVNRWNRDGIWYTFLGKTGNY